MLDGHGYVAEATVDNFFIVTDHALLTPPTAANLKGVTRETLLALAESLEIKAEEKLFTLFDVWTSKEAFICGTGAEVVPVLSVDDRRRRHRAGHRPHRRGLTKWCGRRARRSGAHLRSARSSPVIACRTVASPRGSGSPAPRRCA